MIDREELIKDFHRMSIDEALKKNNLSFPKAMNILRPLRSPCEYGERQYYRTGEKYVYQVGNRVFIRRKEKGKMISYGNYLSIEDAVKVRDWFEVHGWNKSRLKYARRACGVKGV